MTAVEWPSLDALLKAATPVEPSAYHEIDWVLLREQRDQARSVSCSLEAELAQQTARVNEAAALLSDALLWHSSETDNTAVACQEALALLTGEAD